VVELGERRIHDLEALVQLCPCFKQVRCKLKISL
jgi:hypothetical protein